MARITSYHRSGFAGWLLRQSGCLQARDDGGRFLRAVERRSSLYRPADPVDNLKYMEPSSTSPTLIGERPEMSEQDRVNRLSALWDRLVDPDGFDREALKNIEQLDERDQ